MRTPLLLKNLQRHSLALRIIVIFGAMGVVLIGTLFAGFRWSRDNIEQYNATQMADLLVDTLTIGAQAYGDDANLIRLTTALGANRFVVSMTLINPQTDIILASTRNEYIGHDFAVANINTPSRDFPNLQYLSRYRDQFIFAESIKVFSPSMQSIRDVTVFLQLDGNDANGAYDLLLEVLFAALVGILLVFAIIIFWVMRYSLFLHLGHLRNAMLQSIREISDELRIPCHLNELQQLEWSFRRMSEARNAVEKELLLAKEKAEAASRAKNIFIGNMSHELRTPLNAIIGYSQHLLRSSQNTDDRLAKSLQAILESGNSLLKFVNYILDFAKMDAGELRLDIKRVNLQDLFRAMEARLESQINAKGLRFEMFVDSDLLICADAKRLQNILENLLQNSLAYTDAGWIRITAEQTAENIIFSIEDTGRGIPEADIPRLFNRFESLNAQSEMQVGLGSGLGLAIVKDLVYLHGGSIDVHSCVGQGTCVRISLPQGICGE